MIHNFLIEKIKAPEEYFKNYLNDILIVLENKNDGGFEDSIKYYLSSNLIRKFEKTHRIYTGNTPKEYKPEGILFFQKNIKPDLVAVNIMDHQIDIFEIKTFVKKEFLFSFIFSKDGTEKNYYNKIGDYWKQYERIKVAKENNINCNCYLLVFYKESDREPSPLWKDRFREKVAENKITTIYEDILIENKLGTIKSLLLQVHL
jgi:hypothetical protein